MMGLEGVVGEVKKAFQADLLVSRRDPLRGLGGLDGGFLW